MYTGASAMTAMTNFQRSQDTLWTLAADTGGKALLDVNDLSMGIVQAQKAFSSYYILGYYTSNANLDGKFRRIKISLREGVSGDLDYRQGYYAGKEFSKFTTADKERQLEDALMLGDPITELTIAMEVDYFQLNRRRIFRSGGGQDSGSELALAKKGGAEHTLLDFIGEVKDEFGTTESNVRDKVDVKLSDATAAELAKRPIEYDTGFTLLPGKYTIKLLARDAETGRIGTYQTTFVIPNLNKEEKRIPISSVVLSSQRVDMKDAVFNAAKDKDKGADPAIRESAGAGRDEADSQRHARIHAEPGHVRLSSGLPAERGHGAPAGCVRDLLSRPDQGVRDAADAGHREPEQPSENDAAEVQLPAAETAARRVSVPGDRARSDGREGRVLAGPGDARAVRSYWRVIFTPSFKSCS